jgi:hypothetical protein
VAKTKVFCIGFQKTGTSSMEKALQHLGYRVAGVFGVRTSFEELQRTYVETGLKAAAASDAVQDMPFPLMFRELDQAFPGSRFVLTMRDSDSWFRSISSHFNDTPSGLQQLTYGEDAPAPVGHEARYRQVYEAHNAAVLDYFKDRPADLLVMDLQRGDGWEQLCPFIDEAVPNVPFAHANSAKVRERLLYRAAAQLRKYGVPVPDHIGR